MKRRLTHHLALAALALSSLCAQPVAAQKTGTTITLDGNSCHALYSSGAGKSDKTTQYFGYLRHDIAHVQLISSNSKSLSSTGTGVFRQNANNMLFDKTTQSLKMYNWSGNAKYAYYAVVAPKGYRFMSYSWDINVDSSKVGTSVAQYTYDSDGNIVLLSDSVKVEKDMGKWVVNMANGSNVLYFRYNALSTTATALFLNSLKLTYVIDQPFDGNLPNSYGETYIHTGIIDMGEFENKTLGSGTLNVFDRDYVVSDNQKVNIYNGTSAASETIVSVDGADYYAAGNGDYYIEAPEKFRIVGADFKFLRSNATQTEYSFSKVYTPNNGSSFIITDENGHYLSLVDGELIPFTNPALASNWTVTRVSNNSSQYYLTCDGYYLTSWSGLRVYTSTSSLGDRCKWTFTSSGSIKNVTDGYLVFDNSWKTVSTASSGYAYCAVMSTTNQTYPSGNYAASVYTRDNQPGTDYNLSTNNDTQEITVSNYNNDAIHFNISGLVGDSCALYTVNLKLLPLNPELQNLSVASEVDGKVIENTTSFTSENYYFNSGNNVKVIVPSTTTATQCNVRFLNAYNEEGTLWYTTGENENSSSTGGYSNYFLVNSAADNGGTDVNLNLAATPYDTARVQATQAGTSKLLFTNIKDVYDGNASYLVENDFSKTSANYGTATLTIDGDAATYYIYTADQPTFNILKDAGIDSKHIDFRYFTLSLICKKQIEVPVVTLKPIYTSTLKSQNHKNSSIASDGDTMSDAITFIGVEVDSNVDEGTKQGYLTSKQVVDAIKTAITTNTQDIEYSSEDPLRGVLYIDMIKLSGVDNSQFTQEFHNSTADNCLYFMYENFHRENVVNVVAKTADGYEAVSNIVVSDQQPFYSPYDFTTGSYTATYEREGTVQGQTVKATVKNMAVVLPFDVKLDGYGHLKTASDAIDNTVTYHNITGSGELTNVRPGDAGELTYAVVAEPATDGTAEANTPYYVTTTSDGFTYKILGAQFRATTDTLTRTNGSWKAIGTFSGAQPTKADNLWYFAKNYFWKSSNLKNYNCVDVRPFRAYFTTTDQTSSVKATVVFSGDDVVSTGIGSVNAGNQLYISVANSAITATADNASDLTVYTLAGQLVAKAKLSAGESRTVSVQKGVYIVNNVKVVVK